jgi:hypothetical protein
MVNLTSIVSTIIGFAAIASAIPTLEKRAVTCREDLGSGSYGRVSRSHEKQAHNKAITNNLLRVKPGQRSRRVHHLPRQLGQPALRIDHQRPKLLPTRQHPDHWNFQEGSGYLELVSPSLSLVCFFRGRSG